MADFLERNKPKSRQVILKYLKRREKQMDDHTMKVIVEIVGWPN